MSLSALRSVGDALDVTRQFLMPIAARKIGLLAFIVAFMGTAGTPVPASPQFLDPRLWRGLEQTPAETDIVTGISVGAIGEILAVLPAWATPVIIGILFIGILYLITGMLMRFVLVEALQTGTVRIIQPAKVHIRDAFQVVVFRAVLWGLLLLPIGGAVSVVLNLGPDWLPSAPAIVAVGGVLAIGLWIIDVLTIQFVLPVMIHKGEGIISAWRRFTQPLRAHWIEYVVYAVIRVLLGVAVGILALIAVAVGILSIGIILGTVAGIIILLSGGLGSFGTGTTAILGILGLVFIVASIVVFAVVSVPFHTYLWYYALLVLGDTDEDLDLIAEQRATARENGELSQGGFKH